MQKMDTVEEQDHSGWNLLAHSHFDVRSCVEGTAGVHDEDPHSSQEEVHECQEEEDAYNKRARDESEDANEEENNEGDYDADSDFEPPLTANQEFHIWMWF